MHVTHEDVALGPVKKAEQLLPVLENFSVEEPGPECVWRLMLLSNTFAAVTARLAVDPKGSIHCLNNVDILDRVQYVFSKSQYQMIVVLEKVFSTFNKLAQITFLWD